MCSLFSVFTLFYVISGDMSTNVRKFRFPCLFDTCDVVYNRSIFRLSIVLDNLFRINILKKKPFNVPLTQFYSTFKVKPRYS